MASPLPLPRRSAQRNGGSLRVLPADAPGSERDSGGGSRGGDGRGGARVARRRGVHGGGDVRTGHGVCGGLEGFCGRAENPAGMDLFCVKCKKPIDGSAHFCPDCGASQTRGGAPAAAVTPVADPVPEPPTAAIRTRSRRSFYVIGAMAGVILLPAACRLFSSGGLLGRPAFIGIWAAKDTSSDDPSLEGRIKMIFKPDGHGSRDHDIWNVTPGSPKLLIPQHSDFTWTTESGSDGKYVIWKLEPSGVMKRDRWSISDDGRMLTLQPSEADAPAETLERSN